MLWWKQKLLHQNDKFLVSGYNDVSRVCSILGQMDLDHENGNVVDEDCRCYKLKSQRDHQQLGVLINAERR